MKPIRYPIQIYQNAAFKLRLTYRDANQTPIDLSGYTGEFVLRRNVREATALIRSTSIAFGAADENIVVSLTATETDELPTNNQEQEDWAYEVMIWDPLDKENTAQRVVEGRCCVIPSVARPDDV